MRAMRDDRDYWQKGVAEMRAVTREIADPDVKHRLLALVECYERLAQQSESQAERETTPGR